MSLRSRRWIAVLACATALAVPAFGQVTVPTSGSASLPSGGSVSLGCTDLNVGGNVAVGAGQLTQGATVNINASGVLNGGQGLISTGAGWVNNGSFVAGSSTVVFSDACAAGPFQFGGSTTFFNLTFTSTSGRTFVIPAGTNLVVLGTLTLQGVSGNPLQLVSSVPGATANIVLGPAAKVVNSNAVVDPNVQIGNSANAIPTLGETGLVLLALLLMLAGAKTQSLRRLARRNK